MRSNDPATWRALGRYEIGPRLATGGMAELFLGRSRGVHGFEKYFAIKRIAPAFVNDREFVEMFLDEARLAAQLDHPNVGAVVDIGDDDDGPFFAMEYIHGRNLRELSERLRERGRTLDWAAWTAIGSAAAAALHHAHGRRGFDGRALGIIHRDVSPTNIIVTYEGAVKLVDFGIAKASTSRHATRPSVRKGKMAYLSPEQCRSDAIDRRADVFALGVVLFELATGTRAFTGDGEFAVMNQIVNHDLPLASSRRTGIPAAVDRILARATARDPAQRHPDARELQRELDAFAAEAGLAATSVELAATMDALFDVPPYPWLDDAVVGAPSPTAVGDRDATVATVAKPAHMPTVAQSRPRRVRWWVAGAAASALVAVWATRAESSDVPHVEPSGEAPTNAPPVRAPADAEVSAAPPPAKPAAPAPAPLASSQAVAPAPVPASVDPRSQRRRATSSARERRGPGAVDPSLRDGGTRPPPEPVDDGARFDPDAPAPRVR